MAKKKAPMEVSVTGTAVYAWLDKPDTKFAGKGEKGKYKLTIMVDKDEVKGLAARVGADEMPGEEWLEHLREAHKQAGGSPNTSPVKDGDKPIGSADSPKEEFVGKWLVGMKSGYQPKFVDAKKNTIDPEGPIKIMSGDVVKAAYTVYDFDKGVSLRLAAVQLIEKRSNGGNAVSAFGEEDGFEAPAATDTFGGDDDAKPTAAAAGDDDGDF